MNDLKIFTVLENSLTRQQKQAVEKLNEECFNHVPTKEIEECFYAKSFARTFAYRNDEIIGHLRLFKRNTEHDGKKVTLGGIGGVCVTRKMRRKGIATKMIKQGLRTLKQNKCDVACLNADLTRNAHKFYETIGFTMMNRKVSFEDKHGKTRHDKGTMFIPICSKTIYHHVMNSDKTFHYGKGYW
jgi:predicted GNAT family N-acyltransferase